MVGLDLGMRGGGSVPTVSYMGSGEEDTLFSALVPGKGAPPGGLVNFFLGGGGLGWVKSINPFCAPSSPLLSSCPSTAPSTTTSESRRCLWGLGGGPGGRSYPLKKKNQSARVDGGHWPSERNSPPGRASARSRYHGDCYCAWSCSPPESWSSAHAGLCPTSGIT